MTQGNLEKSDFTTLLRFRVGSGQVHKTKKFIDDHSEFMDLSDAEINPDGELFCLAMKNSPEMLKLLVDTYVQSKLQGDHSSVEYLTAKVKLKNMLEEQIDSSPYEFDELDEAIQAILRPWMPEDVDSDLDEQDLASFDDVFEEGGNGHQDACTAHEQQIPEFCGWPEALLYHRHLNGENGNCHSPEVH